MPDSRFNISAKDRQKRIDKITQLDKQVQEAIQSYNVYVQYKSGQIADDEQPLMRGPQGADGEYDNTRDKTNSSFWSNKRLTFKIKTKRSTRSSQ